MLKEVSEVLVVVQAVSFSALYSRWKVEAEPVQVRSADSEVTLEAIRLPGGGQEAQLTVSSKPLDCTPPSEVNLMVSGPAEDMMLGIVPVPQYSPNSVPLVPTPS